MKRGLIVIVSVLMLMLILPREVLSAQSGKMTITVTIINKPPQVGTITPSSGSSSLMQPVTFTTTFSDPDGWENIRYAFLLINTAINGAKCLYVYYDQNTNKLYLRNDANTAWLGGYAPGAYMSIENSYAKLDCSMTAVSGSGTNLTIKWNVTFFPTFTGNKNMYLSVRDDNGLSSGWKTQNNWKWTINQSPRVGTISIYPPAPIRSKQPVTFTTTYSALGGYRNINYVYFLIMDKLEKNRLYCYYSQNTNQLYILHLKGSPTSANWIGGFAPGSAGKVIDTPYVKLDCAKTTATGSGETLTVKWNITLKSGFTGANNGYLFVTDDFGGYSSYVQKGTWTIQP